MSFYDKVCEPTNMLQALGQQKGGNTDMHIFDRRSQVTVTTPIVLHSGEPNNVL